MVDQAGAYAYNSWWQFRADSWSRLEEATGRIVTALRRIKPIDQQHDRCCACGVRGAWRRWSSSGRFLAMRPSASSRSSRQPEPGNGWHGWWLGSIARSSRSPTASVPSTKSPKASIATTART